MRRNIGEKRTYSANAKTFSNAVINQFSDHTADVNLLAPAEMLKLSRIGNGGKRRSYFSEEQVEQIYVEMRERIKFAGAHTYRRHYAVVFCRYVTILLRRGMRVGELRSL